MKKYFLYIIVIFFTLTSGIFALQKNNTDINIKKAKLLENYVLSINNNISTLKIKYNIRVDKDINIIQRELKIILNSLKKIQSKKIDKKISEDVTKEVIKRLKNINKKLNRILSYRKLTFELNSMKLTQKYINISLLLSNKVNTIVTSLYIPIKNKKYYSLKEWKIIKRLKKLLKENKKLKNLKNEKFKDENEIKIKILEILKNIKKEIHWLKSIYWLNKLKL